MLSASFGVDNKERKGGVTALKRLGGVIMGRSKGSYKSSSAHVGAVLAGLTELSDSEMLLISQNASTVPL